MKIKTTLLLLIILNISSYLNAQSIDADQIHLRSKLNNLFADITNSRDDRLRSEKNDSILKILREALQSEESLLNPFDSIRSIGIISSDDAKLRVFTWNIPFNDGTHKYFGFVQYQPNRRNYRLFELVDKSEDISDPGNIQLDEKHWFGCLYYDIIETKSKENVYYTLLAMDLNDWLTSKKIIDVLVVDKDQLTFGWPIFKVANQTMNRMVFEYSSKVSMLLRYDIQMEFIVFDHLAPDRPSLVNQFEFYGPDFSYDGLKFEDGYWNAYFDLDLRNQ